MANSKYEYVRAFEQPDILLPDTWIVVRIDGRSFHKLSAKYEFNKPNDKRALDLMNAAAEGVMKDLPDLVLAYGQSDEFNFIFHKNCTIFERRESKLVTIIVSTFTSYYVYLWSSYFKDSPLCPPLPSFDGRSVLYPNDRLLRDYMSWRQVDCHINNLYNTTFWAIIQKGGMNRTEAEEALMGTVASDKHEILFSRFGINYNNEPEMFKKGSVLYRDYTGSASSAIAEVTDAAYREDEQSADKSSSDRSPDRLGLEVHPASANDAPAPISKTQMAKDQKLRKKARIAIEHVDIIRDDFWLQRPWILSGKAGRSGK